MRVLVLRSVIPLFGRCKGHSFVPTDFCNAAARSSGQGLPQGRCGCAQPLTVASTAARPRSCGAMLLIILRRAAWVFVFCAVAVVLVPMVKSSTRKPAVNLLLDTAAQMLSDRDNGTTIVNQPGRGLLAAGASLTVAWGVQGEADQGGQDKSADVCRAHMVGWIEVLRRPQQCGAGAFAAKFNSISTQSASAGKTSDQRPL